LGDEVVGADRDTIEKLIDGRLPWPQLHSLISAYKDSDRFGVYRELLQQRVLWTDPIVLPLTPKLFIVDGGNAGIIKCECGRSFGDYRKNWKHEASIRVRRSAAELEEVFGPLACDADWMEVREFICPGCASLLEVETAVPGYPFIHDFVPDLHAFYQDWLREQPPAWALASSSPARGATGGALP
jgi:acetone carboxylase gamma subunit